jgi:NAD(P)-dependent dehydrogenase (short-subunit alcohol dehydrogenase family)
MATASNVKRVWLITGAARGIGATIADAALADGDAVVATGRNAQSVLDRFGERPRLLAAALDVTKEDSIATGVEAAIAKFGRIDVLVNNAGFGVIGAIEETSPEDIRRIFETNVFGLMNVTRAALPHLRAQRSGHIINLSSVGGYQSGPGYGVYCSTKFAVEAISEALHDELAPLGIRVTVVEPGYFRTDFLDATSVVESKTRIADYDATAGEVRKAAKAVNHRQPGDPVKLAKALVEIVKSEAPPLRLALGTDALGMIEDKNAFVQRELNAWRKLSASTDFASNA